MNELINTAMMIITVLLGFSIALMIIYGIYRVIKWYDNRNYYRRVDLTQRLWDRIGELN